MDNLRAVELLLADGHEYEYEYEHGEHDGLGAERDNFIERSNVCDGIVKAWTQGGDDSRTSVQTFRKDAMPIE